MKYKIITLVGVIGIASLLWISTNIFVTTDPSIGSESWVHEKIKAYPEISWLSAFDKDGNDVVWTRNTHSFPALESEITDEETVITAYRY